MPFLAKSIAINDADFRVKNFVALLINRITKSFIELLDDPENLLPRGIPRPTL
jgi:hypothetical protein